MRKIFVLVTLLSISCVALAVTESAVDTIGAVHAKEDGEAYLYLSSGESANASSFSCTTNYPYTYDASTPQGQVLHSTILSAFMSGKSVRMYINSCLSGKPKVVRVNVYK